VLERIPDLRPGGALAHWARQGAVLVAGSSDTLDARLLLTVLAAVRRSQPAARLLLCPHEPSQQHTAHVLRLALELGVMATRWTLNTAAPRENTDCVVVEHVGLLADLYALGQAAYVGGGLGPAGVHAVIEPAAYGLPVLMGSRGLSQDALALLAAGGAIALPTRGPGAALVNAWLTWLTHDAVRIRAGLAARGVLSAGAAARTTSRLLELI
jgi:3-deoxy-D-manno-octulosonic-acid transferase